MVCVCVWHACNICLCVWCAWDFMCVSISVCMYVYVIYMWLYVCMQAFLCVCDMHVIVCLCVWLWMHVSVVCVCVCVCVCVYACVSQRTFWSVGPIFYLVWSGSLHCFLYEVWQAVWLVSGNSPGSTSHLIGGARGSQMCAIESSLTWVLGIQIQILTFAHQVLYALGYFSSPSLLCD